MTNHKNDTVKEITTRSLRFFIAAYLLLGLIGGLLGIAVAESLAASPTGVTMDDIAGRLNQAKELTETLELPEAKEAANAQKYRQAAEEIVHRFQAPEHQAVIIREQQRLQDDIFADVMRDYRPTAGDDPAAAPGRLAENERVYLFFSSSVPIMTMQNYMAMIERTQDPNVIMVMRGFVGGMREVRPTLEYLYAILQKDPACKPMQDKCDAYEVNIQIDPLLFRQYTISKAPTVVFATGVSIIDNGRDQAAGPAYIIEGDASLDYLLKRINREAKSETLAGLTRALQGAY